MTLTLLSWNVNGARAIYRAGFLNWLAEVSPDIVCLQETRAEPQQLPPDLAQPAPYAGYWAFSTRKKGHSGTGILSHGSRRCRFPPALAGPSSTTRGARWLRTTAGLS